MTATLPDVAARKKQERTPEQQVAAELVRQAKERGLSLTGPDGLLKQLTKTVIESALAEEMTEHLGYEKHDPAGAGTGNIRNGTRGKTVLTEASGPVEIEVPRDRAWHVRAADREEASAPARGGRPGGDLAVCEGADHRGDQCALR
jgi:hypothetical protein